VKALIIESHGGTRIAARVFEPNSLDCGSVVVGGAMGVRQDYYAPFAQWLATQGWRVLTFDYRGSGDSGPSGKELKGYKADLDLYENARVPCSASHPPISAHFAHSVANTRRSCGPAWPNG
jgi:predicted alpha/beta hydrolase